MNRKYHIINCFFAIFYALIISIFLLTASSGCNTVSSDEVSKATKKKRYNSIQLINKSLAEGKIDRDKAYLLKAYALFDVKKLPEEYRSDIPMKDGTMLIREIRRVFDELGAEAKAKIRPYLFTKGRER